MKSIYFIISCIRYEVQKQAEVCKVLTVVTFAEDGWVVSGGAHQGGRASGVQMTCFLIWVPVRESVHILEIMLVVCALFCITLCFNIIV